MANDTGTKKTTIDTLIPDIQKVFTNQEHEISEKNLEELAENIKEVVRTSVLEASVVRKPYLRMSKIGTPERKLWYEMNRQKEDVPVEVEGDDVEEVVPLDPTLAMKFLYGHLLEQVLLFFIKEAGHTLEGTQETLEINGVEGHRDAKIDGINVDIKTASFFGFKKFSEGSLLVDDPFGYIAQLSGYVYADEGALDKGGAFLALNKESGELALLKIDSMDLINPEERIDRLQKVIDLPSPPSEKCYQPKPDGKSGNMMLHKNCTYCPFKVDCWKDANNGRGLRGFQYSNGTKYLTEVHSEPTVPEVKLYEEEFK